MAFLKDTKIDLEPRATQLLGVGCKFSSELPNGQSKKGNEINSRVYGVYEIKTHYWLQRNTGEKLLP